VLRGGFGHFNQTEFIKLLVCGKWQAGHFFRRACPGAVFTPRTGSSPTIHRVFRVQLTERPLFVVCCACFSACCNPSMPQGDRLCTPTPNASVAIPSGLKEASRNEHRTLRPRVACYELCVGCEAVTWDLRCCSHVGSTVLV
jgi:hypothetical protein